MLGQIVNNGGTLEIRNLAGSSSDGMPIGSILALHDNRVPYGFLPCNGGEFDTTLYPALYTLLRTNKLPDLREMNLVGIGTNATANIAAHDVYTLGQFKDDQLQSHIHVTCVGHLHSGSSSASVAKYETFEGCDAYLCCTCAPFIARTGTTTHGKNYGVFYVIKAVTGAVDIDDAQIFSEVQDFLADNYTKTNFTNFVNGAIAKWDAQNNEWVPITYPTASDNILISNVSTTTIHDYYYTIDSASYFGPSLEPKPLPAGTATTEAVVDTDIVYYNETFYKYDSGDWKIVDEFTTAGAEATVTVTDSDLIDALDAETKSNLTMLDYAESTNSYDYCWTGASSVAPSIKCVQSGFYPLMVANENCPKDFYRLNCTCRNGVTAQFVCDTSMGDNTYFDIRGCTCTSGVATWVDVNPSATRIGSCNTNNNAAITTAGGRIESCARFSGGTALTNAVSGNYLAGRCSCSWSCSTNGCCKSAASVYPTCFRADAYNCCTNKSSYLEMNSDFISVGSGADSGFQISGDFAEMFSCNCGINSNVVISSTGSATMFSGDDECCNASTMHCGCCGRRQVNVYKFNDDCCATHIESTCIPSYTCSTTSFEDAFYGDGSVFVRNGVCNVACSNANCSCAKLYFCCCDSDDLYCKSIEAKNDGVHICMNDTTDRPTSADWKITNTICATLNDQSSSSSSTARVCIGDSISNCYQWTSDNDSSAKYTCTQLGHYQGNVLTTCVLDSNGCACRSGICTTPLGITEFVDNLDGNGAAAIHSTQTSYDVYASSIIQSSDSNGSCVCIDAGEVDITACCINLNGITDFCCVCVDCSTITNSAITNSTLCNINSCNFCACCLCVCYLTFI